jgi:endonuclease/exonuclease/phosphatase family metal-dependent hydrolase
MAHFGRFFQAAAASLFSFTVALAQAQEPIKILTWNLEHFVDPYDDPYVQAQQDDQPQVKSMETLKLLGEALARMDADVMVFEEVEGDRAVKLLIDSFLPGNDYKYYASVPSKEWYQNVVVVSRFPIGEIISLREVEIYNDHLDKRENKYNSRLMGVEIMPSEDYKLFVVGLHLKAGGDPEDPIWRTEQIKAIKEMMAGELKEDPNLNIIVTGDLNLTPDSSEYEYLVRAEPVKLIDPAEQWGLPFTHPSDNPRRRIDHILLNDNISPEYVADSISVARPLAQEDLAKISDHLPVVLSIVPKDAEAKATQ